MKGDAQTSKSNGDDIQIDDSLTGMIVDTEGQQDTQAEIMGNNTTTEANVPPPTEPTIYRHRRQSWTSRTIYKHETRNKYYTLVTRKRPHTTLLTGRKLFLYIP